MSATEILVFLSFFVLVLIHTTFCTLIVLREISRLKPNPQPDRSETE